MIAVYHEYLFKMRKISLFNLKLIAKIIVFTVRVGSMMLSQDDYSMKETSFP